MLGIATEVAMLPILVPRIEVVGFVCGLGLLTGREEYLG
jgi:hypothetical protein